MIPDNMYLNAMRAWCAEKFCVLMHAYRDAGMSEPIIDRVYEHEGNYYKVRFYGKDPEPIAEDCGSEIPYERRRFRPLMVRKVTRSEFAELTAYMI